MSIYRPLSVCLLIYLRYFSHLFCFSLSLSLSLNPPKLVTSIWISLMTFHSLSNLSPVLPSTLIPPQRPAAPASSRAQSPQPTIKKKNQWSLSCRSSEGPSRITDAYWLSLENILEVTSAALFLPRARHHNGYTGLSRDYSSSLLFLSRTSSDNNNSTALQYSQQGRAAASMLIFILRYRWSIVIHTSQNNVVLYVSYKDTAVIHLH